MGVRAVAGLMERRARVRVEALLHGVREVMAEVLLLLRSGEEDHGEGITWAC